MCGSSSEIPLELSEERGRRLEERVMAAIEEDVAAVRDNSLQPFIISIGISRSPVHPRTVLRVAPWAPRPRGQGALRVTENAG
jgi:hypothetical protein